MDLPGPKAPQTEAGRLRIKNATLMRSLAEERQLRRKAVNSLRQAQILADSEGGGSLAVQKVQALEAERTRLLEIVSMMRSEVQTLRQHTDPENRRPVSVYFTASASPGGTLDTPRQRQDNSYGSDTGGRSCADFGSRIWLCGRRR